MCRCPGAGTCAGVCGEQGRRVSAGPGGSCLFLWRLGDLGGMSSVPPNSLSTGSPPGGQAQGSAPGAGPGHPQLRGLAPQPPVSVRLGLSERTGLESLGPRAAAPRAQPLLSPAASDPHLGLGPLGSARGSGRQAGWQGREGRFWELCGGSHCYSSPGQPWPLGMPLPPPSAASGGGSWAGASAAAGQGTFREMPAWAGALSILRTGRLRPERGQLPWPRQPLEHGTGDSC